MQIYDKQYVAYYLNNNTVLKHTTLSAYHFINNCSKSELKY